ncbi:MAG: YciI family protein [Hamadaea sp.]|uniref:YciI family protein n=1 Tax=Hamadaea sp. NPDC050747 TaxID=3155789 RepID=UPI00184CF27E|nr:YciI family protein [Hamadaea sp.]NUR47372.1 YciI family protein [Hamadaea sp.]NUT08680.1 YciI family protein [Hamadaea sp.]
MKYVVLIHSNPASWVHPMFLHQHEPLEPEARETKLKEFAALMTEIHQSGELVESAALDAPSTTKTLRIRDEQLTVTDGPFVDVKEHLAGFFLIDVASEERAIEIASRMPDARYGTVELRPLADLSDMER